MITMNTLPSELIQYIIHTHLDDKSQRMLRLASRSWFECVKYNRFTFHFSTTTIPQAVFDRLATYNHLISMRILNSIEFTNESLDQLAKLTNLVSIEWPYYQPHDELLLDWFKLSTLTNLSQWEHRTDNTHALELLAKLSNLTSLECDAFDYDEVDAIKYATKLEYLFLRWLDPDTNLWNIAHLTRLTRLMANISVDYDGEDPADFIKQIEAFTNLRQLNLSVEVPQTQFPPLSIGKFTTIQRLSVSGIPIQLPCDKHAQLDADPQHYIHCALSSLKNLQSLDITVTSIEELNSIKPLTHLTSLSLHFKQELKDLPLLPLPNLVHLNLHSNQFAIDAAITAQLTRLKYLDLSSGSTCQNSDIIGKLPNLERISCWYSTDSTEFISHLTNLKSAQFINVKFPTRICLTHLTRLNRLCISRSIDALSWQCISDLKYVEHMTLAFEEGEADLHPLTKFDRIKTLDLMLSQVKLHNIDALFNMTSLVDLQLKDFGCIEDYSQISRLTQLTYLSVLGGNVTHDHVTNLTRLTFVSLNGKMEAFKDVKIV